MEVNMAHSETIGKLASALVKERAPIPCPCCGAAMIIVRTRIPPVLVGRLAIPTAVRGAL